MKRKVALILFFLFAVNAVYPQRIRQRKIMKMITRSEILNGHFTGFALYDLGRKQMIAEQNGDKYFTPASNTKLFTFYAGMKLLGDSIEGLHYVERGDSLIFWGTGDPTFLNPDYPSQAVLDKMKASDKKIYWAAGTYTGEFYGTGWTYDDYNEYYQPEISELPVYGNIIRFSENKGDVMSFPRFNTGGPFSLLNDSLKWSGNFRIHRDLMSNIFRRPDAEVPADYQQQVPFKTSVKLVGQILEREIPNFGGVITYRKPPEYQVWHSVPSDSLFRNMLPPSDNFLAEQILLNIAASKGLEMNTAIVIDYIIEMLLQDLPDKPVWVDGSGLSRQDLFTPRSIIRLCEKIYDDAGYEKHLFNLLPNGGKTGTLKNLYKSEEPFVFAKTGSLSNNHNQSGFLITKSGMRLIYSFMNNNFVRPTADVRKEMERIVTYIHQNY